MGPWLFAVFRGFYNPQLCRDYNQPLQGSLLNKQTNNKQYFRNFMDMAHFVRFDPMFFLPTIYPMVSKCWIGYPWIYHPPKDAIGKWRFIHQDSQTSTFLASTSQNTCEELLPERKKRPLHFFGCKLSRQDHDWVVRGWRSFHNSGNDGRYRAQMMGSCGMLTFHLAMILAQNERGNLRTANFHTWSLGYRT